MILYLLFGLLMALGAFRVFQAILGKQKKQERLGSFANVYAYCVAILFPFSYIVMAALFGIGVLVLLSLTFDASFMRRVLAISVTLALLMGTRVLSGYFTDGLAMYAVCSFAFFSVASVIYEASRKGANKENEERFTQMLHMAAKEKDELTALHMQELNSYKKAVSSELGHALVLLDRFKVEDAEKLIGELVRKQEQ